MSYFHSLQEEEYTDSYGSSSTSDRFHDESDSRDRVRRPLARGTATGRGSVASAGSATTRSSSSSTADVRRSKKKKKKTQSIPEEPTANIPSTVVRNDSQGDSSMASESYTLRSNGLSFGSSTNSANILDAYKKLRASHRGSTSATASSSLPRHHEEGEYGSSSANTHDTPASDTQQTPATSTSTQMSTDDDHYLNNSHPSQHKNSQRAPRPPGKDLVPEYDPPEYPPKRASTRQKQKLEQKSIPEYGAPEDPPQEQAPMTTEQLQKPKQQKRNSVAKTTKKRASKRVSKINGEINRNSTGSGKQPRKSTVTKSPYDNASKQQPHQIPQQAIPVQQVYASYTREAPPSLTPYGNGNARTQSINERNMALHKSAPPSQQPIPIDTNTQQRRRNTTGRGVSTSVPQQREQAPPSDDEKDSLDDSEWEQQQPQVPLKQSLQSGADFDRQYSRKMAEVSRNLRSTIKVSNTDEGGNGKKNRKSSRKLKKGIKEEGSSQGSLADMSSSSSSSSGGNGIMGFLGNFRGHPKNENEEEKRKAQNPFLNRPTPVKKAYNTIGHFGDKKGKSKKNIGDDSSSSGSSSSVDHQRRRDTDDSSYSSYSSSEETKKERCPLPPPVRKVQQFCGRIVTNTQFQVFMIILIMLNALVLGIATYDFDNPKVPETLEIIDRVLLVIFTIELALQFGYCGINLFLDGWLVFDCLTVVTSWWLEGVQVFRSFRIFRSFRLIVRLPLLKNLVLTVFHVMPRIYSILCLLLLVLYVFGVLVTILYGEHPWGPPGEEVDYFGHLGLSIFTLFQMVTLEGWGDVVRLVAVEHKVSAALIFTVFIVVTGFIMYNLIVAVMCDSMLVIEAQGREDLREQQKQRKILDEIARQEEEKRLHDEMLVQRKELGGERERLSGIVSDDPTIPGDPTENNTASQLSSEHSLTLTAEDTEEEEEDIEYRTVQCPNCEHCQEIQKYSSGFRHRKMTREAMMTENQERVQLLNSKMEQMAETQERVTNVLQALMREIEESRRASLGSDGDTLNESMGGFSLEEYQNARPR